MFDRLRARAASQSVSRRGGTLRRRLVGATASGAVIALLAALTAGGSPAVAAPGLGLDPDTNPPSATTESTIIALEDTSGLYGGQVPGVTATTPYPSRGLEDQRSVTTAQLILSTGPGANDRVETYCIDLNTDTTVGVHYELDSWTEANVPNLPYVQWILQNYYPQQPTQPVGGTAAEKVRAVQGAIWYFTDGFVVSRFYPAERAAVESIVAAAQAAVTPTPAPPVQPTLTVAPPAQGVPVPGAPFGPYTVDGTIAQSSLTRNAGTAVFADAAGVQPLADGAAIARGAQLYIGYDPDVAGQGFLLTATAEVEAGNVFLYDGSNPPRTAAQKLIAATDSTITLRASGALVPPAAGAYELSVDIGGAAAGDQGRIGVTVTCIAGEWQIRRDFVVPARTAEGTIVLGRVDGVVSGAVCAAVQTADGSNASATLTSSVLTPAAPVVVASGRTATAVLANDYAVPVAPTGTLAVDVRIAGDAAGLQSEIRAEARCVAGSATIVRDVTLPAGATGVTRAATIAGVPVGAVCELTQTTDGRNERAALTGSSIEPEAVTIAADRVSTLLLSDTFGLQVSAVRVDVVPSGEAAGMQSEATVLVLCTSGDRTIDPVRIEIPAALAENQTVGYVDGVPVGYSCVTTLERDGSNALAALRASGIDPDPAVTAYGEDAVVTVSLDYVKPTPGPGPGPGPKPTPALASTGFDASPYLLASAAALAAGLVVVALQLRRRRRG